MKIQERDAKQLAVGVKAGEVIKLGDQVFRDGDYAVKGRSGDAADDALVPLGISEDIVDATNLADGEAKVTIRKGTFARFNDPASLVTADRIGLQCYAVDGETVSRSHSGNTRPSAGIVFDVDDAFVWVTYA